VRPRVHDAQNLQLARKALGQSLIRDFPDMFHANAPHYLEQLGGIRDDRRYVAQADLELLAIIKSWMRRICPEAWCSANASDESVLPPPVGTCNE
jgi:hypothetical protein